jgi:hypothetical protein
MMVEKNRMTENGASVEATKFVEEGDGRQSFSPYHLMEFGGALGNMDLKRQVMLGREGECVADEVWCAGVDLGRAHHPEKPPGRVPADAAEHLGCRVEVALAGLRVPNVFEGMAVAGLPPGIAEHRPDVDAHAAIREDFVHLTGIDAQLELAEVNGRGNPAQEEFSHGDLDGCQGALTIDFDHVQVLVEWTVPKRRAANFVAEALVDRLGRRMRVDVDKPGHDEPARAVDDAVDVT